MMSLLSVAAGRHLGFASLALFVSLVLAADLAVAAPDAPAAPVTSAPFADPLPAAAVPGAPAAEVVPVTGEASPSAANPYGLQALWQQGDFVARGVLGILALMSMGSWYLLIGKLIEQECVLRQARQVDAVFWQARTVREGAGALPENSPFSAVAAAGIRAVDSHRDFLAERLDLHTWVSMSIQRAVNGIGSRLQGGMAFLATVGSVSPFVGLFGTVWGIYHALTAIGIAGQASLDKVAGPVGEALIMTAIGLAVAIPAVMGFNWLTRRNKLVMERVGGFASDLHTLLIGGAPRVQPVARAKASAGGA